MTKNTMTPEELSSSLAQFCGTEGYYKFSMLSPLVMTDGVKYLADNAKCYWLLDIIASYQRKCSRDPMLCDMQFWTLRVKNGKGFVICERDEGDVAISQAIPATDFPLPEIKIWVENGVVLLPSEH